MTSQITPETAHSKQTYASPTLNPEKGSEFRKKPENGAVISYLAAWKWIAAVAMAVMCDIIETSVYGRDHKIYIVSW
ncbi:MAG TPA: hypothetical protein VMT26_01770 [Candidatus Bathyarchaeia archaeon]|nr:hypothetical protein [Candidatus Bathyarchaeia archaeon]